MNRRRILLLAVLILDLLLFLVFVALAVLSQTPALRALWGVLSLIALVGAGGVCVARRFS